MTVDLSSAFDYHSLNKATVTVVLDKADPKSRMRAEGEEYDIIGLSDDG